MLLAVMRLPQFEEVLQSEKLAHALPDGAARHQPVTRVVHQQKLVHVVQRVQAGGKRTSKQTDVQTDKTVAAIRARQTGERRP